MFKYLVSITLLALYTITLEAKEIPEMVNAHSKIRAQHKLSL